VAQTQTWEVIESENHHAMTWLTLWDFTRLLKGSPVYRERKFVDGLTAPEHHAGWCAYAAEYIRQRARKGLFIEMADDTYNSFTLKGFYNIHDFAEDPVLRQLAGDLLTLYYASWAQEQLGGVRGGGKSRMNYAKDRRSSTSLQRLMYYYAGLGGPSPPASQRLAALTSGYRLPEVVIDIMTDPEGRGEYEIADRPPGLAADGRWNNPLYRLRTDTGGIIRYAWCTPDFIMGLPMVRVRKNTHWTKLSSQGRWQGVIFAGDPDARIFVHCGRPEGSHNNQQAGVQRKGTMITQRLPEDKFARGTDGTRVWISDNGLTNRMEEAGWVFVEAPGAYAAVRPARGGYTWKACTEKPSDGSQWRGQWMTFEDEYSPAIIEVARKSRFPDYAAFRQATLALPLTWEGNKLHYQGLCGDQFVFHIDYSKLNAINGEPINDEDPDFAFLSPFLTSRWDSGLVEVRKGERKRVLDFRATPKAKRESD
jgi:hypothetical protein